MGMLDVGTKPVPDLEGAVTAAAEGAAFGEVECRLAPAFVDRAKEQGLFCMALPTELGGLGLPPAAVIEIVERIAHADGAAGWCLFIGNATSFVGWLEPEVALAMSAGAPHIAAASMFGPTGQAVPDGRGRYRVDGRWPFVSGCLHSERIQVGVMVMDGDEIALRRDGRPDWRFAFLSADDLEVLHTWDTLGLRGTGSNDVAAHGVQIDPELLAAPLFDPPRCDGVVYRMGFWPVVNLLVAPFALGVARRALDELVSWLATATATARRPGRDDPEVQHAVGRSESMLLAARAVLDDAVEQAWATAVAGDPISPLEAQRVSLAMHHGVRAALTVVDTCYELAGSSVIRGGDALGRCFRDLQTARKHALFSPEGYRDAARHLIAAAG